MSRLNRLGFVAAGLLVLAVAVGCSSSSSNDIGTDIVNDIPADVPADVVADTNPVDPGAEAVEDVPAVDTPPDIDWETLPRLPAGKTFTLAYAAGVAQKDVSPTQPTHLGGFGFCMGDELLCRSTDGVHDPLLSSAVAIADPASKEVVIFIGVDTIGILRSDIEDIHRRIQQRLYDDFGVYFPGDRALISSSHAHSSCDTVGLWGPGYGAGRQEQYVELLKNGVVESARDAYADLKDVTLDWGKGSYANSYEDAFASDDELFILRGKGADDATMFTMVRYPAHPTTYGSKMKAASADWPGTMRKKLEDDLGGLNVFMQGPIGGVYPNRPSTCGLTEEAFPNGDHTLTDMDVGDYMKTTCTGNAIAEVAKTALLTAQPLAATGITYKATEFPFHPTNGTLMLLAEVGPLPYEFVDVDDPTAMMHSIFAVATVGDLTFITTPGESFPSFGKEAKDIAIEANLTNPIVLGLTQDWMGYLLLEKQWENKDLAYNQSLSPGPGVEPAFMAAMRAMLGLPATVK
jgi:hypothetical protein